METYEVLERALGLIEREEDWCQRALSLDGRRCSVTALVSSGCNYRNPGGLEALCHLAGVPPLASALGRWNDSHAHPEVVALFQAAIRNEKAKAGIAVEVPAGAPVEPQEIAA